MNDKRSQQDRQRAGRTAAITIAGTAALWVVASFIGRQMGVSQRGLLLIDLLALAGFVLAFVMIWQIWRARRNGEG
ncbi:DUF5337 family protein [Rhodalgimonas zhirmunskyi]|uniref:DUF5337 domain-containing protein n=1 Tax=Rhodalgimonas zhirmunskyi TaxID=2964767 RepID=A0AAJ1X6D1_9RHOB|nr:DUF5337 family protein [Rhodoalgimonas zhirmunskyi]MDQ2095376.1 DUF5337 domain-containing protein [Rhodoalgimonas zhirmunskyi]